MGEGELRSYCTVVFRTQKHSYLDFLSTDFGNLFKNDFLLYNLLTVKISGFFIAAATGFSKEKDQN
jgi:hypothetical protein